MHCKTAKKNNWVYKKTELMSFDVNTNTISQEVKISNMRQDR